MFLDMIILLVRQENWLQATCMYPRNTKALKIIDDGLVLTLAIMAALAYLTMQCRPVLPVLAPFEGATSEISQMI